MINKFVFNGYNSLDFGVRISGGGTYVSPSRDITALQVPGRNGDLLIDNGRYNNVEIPYEASIATDFRRRFDAFRAAMLSAPGYHRLEDTYHPDEFRLAAYLDRLAPEMVGQNCSGATFNVVFNCKPQRFLKSGEQLKSLTAPTALHNPGMEALPIITVYGSGAGTVTVGGVTVDIKSLDGYVVLDCDVQDAYKGLENKNNTIYAPEFPTIPPGESRVGWSGGVERLEIVPRWWIL